MNLFKRKRLVLRSTNISNYTSCNKKENNDLYQAVVDADDELEFKNKKVITIIII